MSDTDANRHLTAEELTRLLADELDAYETQVGESLCLVAFPVQKTGRDSTTKVMVKDARGRCLAVVSCARPASPHLVMRGVERAEAVRSLLGHSLGAAIIKPVASGYVEGRSYAMLPWCSDLSEHRLIRYAQRTLLKRPLLSWLRAAVAAAATAHGENAGNPPVFASKLRRMETLSGIGESARTAIRTALDRLESEAWRPRHVFDHNDLWEGNILLPGKRIRPPRKTPFVLIDWVGAESSGYGITDLIRLARFLKLSPAELRVEIEAHCRSLHCTIHDAAGHFLAASGHLHQNLEYFPEDRFLAMFHACWLYLQEALNTENTFPDSL